jgi:hypothetical protein
MPSFAKNMEICEGFAKNMELYEVLPKIWNYMKFCPGLGFRVTWVSPPKLGFFLGF